MPPKTSKTSGPRRKGDEYQDKTSLRFALELFIEGKQYELFIEYENVGNFDDIVIVERDKVNAYQVKHAESPNAVYELDDFTNPKSKVYFQKFSKSWKLLQQQFSSETLIIHLYTNRSLNADLAKVITDEGFFTPAFIEGRVRRRNLEIRKELSRVTELDEKNFQKFLSCFQFNVKQRSLTDQESYIEGELIDHKLGIINPAVFNELDRMIKEYAINRHESLTPETIRKYLENIQIQYLLDQKFEIDRSLYVEQEDLRTKLNKALTTINGNYIVVTGLPGAGKSTSLTAFFDDYEDSSNNPVVRYYCFVDIYDNRQRRRVEAESLRINLLKRMQDRFSEILERRYDYSEQNFIQVLQTLGSHFTKEKKKLIILLDGLDHAERMESEIQDSIIMALPPSLPAGIIFVVGTQELHHWPHFLKKCRKNPEMHIEMSLFNEEKTKEYLINKRGFTQLTLDQISKLHSKSEGLPLYLQYIAEILRESENIPQAIKTIRIIPQGRVLDYYEYLWTEFEKSGKENVKHLCRVLSCLRFPVHKDDLFRYQTEIGRPDFEGCFKQIQHLLRKSRNRIEIFHNSFREFVHEKLSEGLKKEINTGILANLKKQELKDLWFSYVFEYAYESEDYEYILEKVHREFVDNALIHFRPDRDIENAIYWAGESARINEDLEAFSRLGSLKSRTKERLDQLLSRSLLSKALLALGRVEEVIKYSYSFRNNKWLINLETALNILIELPNQEKKKIGDKLFPTFIRSFQDKELDRNMVISYAHCLGIYSKTLAQPLKWLSGIEVEPDVLEPKQAYIPKYAPHLEAYIESIIKYQPDECWKKLKKIKKLFPNQLIRFMLIRQFARHKNSDLLKKEIEEYIYRYKPSSNPEIAYYSALAGLPTKKVNEIAGAISLPPLETPEHLFRSDPCLHNFRMIFSTMAYEGDSINQLIKYLNSKKSWWTTYLTYLAQASKCLGKYWSRAQEEWFDTGKKAIEALTNIQKAEGERIIELLELCRDELVESLYWLTRAVCERYPSCLDEWFVKLKSLQDSNIWTMQYGVMESIEDYSFELKIYERLASLPHCRSHIMEILDVCEKKYRESTFLKGNTRSDHFLKLAYIAAICGSKDKAEEWIREGVKATLIYGYHKDVTLFNLIDIMGMVNQCNHEGTLKRCVDILDMVDWMPHLTDGKETNYLPSYIFEKVAGLDIRVAFQLLRQYAKNKARWKMQDCLETWLERLCEGDLEVLWALTAIFANHFSEDGRHIKLVTRAKQSIVKLAEKTGDPLLLDDFKDRFDHYIRTNITPRHWKTVATDYWQPSESIPTLKHEDESSIDTSKEKSYILDGKSISTQKIKSRLEKTFKEFKGTLQKLREENDHFYNDDLVNSALRHHISKATHRADLLEIKQYFLDSNALSSTDELRQLGHKFITLGEVVEALGCFEMTYKNTLSWTRWEEIQKDLKIITEYDKKRALRLVVDDCYRELTKYNGFEIPTLAASAFFVFKEIDKLENVFSDFLQHCKELFTYLPKKSDYLWLESFSNSKNLNEDIVDFVIKELDDVEIDLVYRVSDALRELCLVRPNLVIPIIIKRISKENEFIQNRLYPIIYMTANNKPEVILPFLDDLTELLSTNHFQHKMLTIKSLKKVAESHKLQDYVRDKLDKAQQDYISIISQSSKLIHMVPSASFKEFYEGFMAKSYKEQISSCCERLKVDIDDVLNRIESTLRSENWSENEERIKIGEEWKNHIHPQGHPGINIITTFNLRVLKIFNEIIDDVLRNTKLSVHQVESIWRIVQPVDPEYGLSYIKTRPPDIPFLSVQNKDEWLSELSKKKDDITYEKINTEWVSLYEKRFLAQDEKHNRPYKSILTVFSSLLKKGRKYSLEELKKVIYNIYILKRYHDNESITLEQAKNILSEMKPVALGNNSYPLLILKFNNPFFFGYDDVVSLPAYLIKQYDLSFKGFDLFDEDNCVVRYEKWQEGYEDETYSRELLSYGTRLLIHADLLNDILLDYDAELGQEINIKRLYFKDIYHREPSERSERTHYKIIKIRT